jgi:adenylosuccinate lyase
MISYSSLLKGLNKLILNEEAFKNDLEENWAVCAEAIQTVLRREAYPKPYEALKDLTRTNAHVTRETLHAFIDGLKVGEDVKAELKLISPHNYTGINPEF